MCKPLLTPAGENLEHNTHVAAQPNLSADGAFRPPPSIGLVDCRAGVKRVGGREVLAGLKNWTKEQFASLPLWCGVIYCCALKLSVEMCQNAVPVGTTIEKKTKNKKNKITTSLMFFPSNKCDKYLCHLEMRAWQVPKYNGTLAVIESSRCGL